jgi:diguanylate cyclase (GGDEF)-like protein
MFIADLIITRRFTFIAAEISIMTLAMGLVFYIWYRGNMHLAIYITGLYGILFTLIIFFERISMRFYMQLMMVLIITIIGYRKKYQYVLTFVIIGPLVLFRSLMDMNPQYFVYVISNLLFTTYILYNFKKGFNTEIETAIALKKAQETDFLTGLPNRRDFENNLRQHMDASDKHIVLIDLDHFKEINDTYGHPVGDEILTQFAVILKKYISEEMYAYRWGGEEFLLISTLARTHLLNTVERLRAEICQTVFVHDIHLTASFGVSQISNQASQVHDGFIRADKALYLAKNSGRNTVKIALDEKAR